jgi:hypothetical protein
MHPPQCCVYAYITCLVTSLALSILYLPQVGEIDCLLHTCPDRTWDPFVLLYSGYQFSFSGVKRSERGVKHQPQSAPELRISTYTYTVLQ